MKVIPMHDAASRDAAGQDAASRNQDPNGVIQGFEVLRAAAALAVVALHAGVPYVRHPMPGLIWPVSDASSAAVDAVFWAIEVVVMPLFLMMAGFLLWRSARKTTPGQLIKSRAERLLIPLAFGMLVVLPIDLYIWTVGLVTEGTVPVTKLKSLKFDPPISDQIWGLSHLWFLLYVFLYVVVAAILIRWTTKRGASKWVAIGSKPKVLLCLLGGTACATLAIAPEVVWGFQHAFLPVPSKWIYSGAFFAAGCGLAFHDRELKWVARTTPRLLSIGVVLLTTSVLLGTWTLESNPGRPGIGQAATLLLALLTVAAAASITLGLIGASSRLITTVPKSIRYVALASFWIYLVHHPLLGLVHIDLKWLWPSGSPIVKLCVSFVAATALSLATFESFVRHTRLGVLLGMSQGNRPHVRQNSEPQEAVAIAERAARPASESDHKRAA